ncbi:hypothetical protein PCANC_10453 [Puccinia coronata f. sp. avenae]|uniref:HAT C-terminal dimerisation domain-containing protein n=1 Tax=Puccinia coronata f. sp. avenae TaxID=200324 RepID=A0A2N5VIB8_9BASI|nr:hypothetical protein PCANC_10453 [Puccinia coronata f. sp. avenae]
MDHFEMEDVVLAPDGDDKSDDDGAKDEGQNKNNCTETKALEIGTNRIDKILKKVDFVIQRIASSAAKQSEYTTWCKKLNFYGPNFIAGYRIQWNIKFQSRNRAYNACKIIRKLIENKKDRQERDGGKNYYNNVEITRANWEVVNKLNTTLSHIKVFLQKKLNDASNNQLQNMLKTMLAKTEKYVNKDLAHYKRAKKLLQDSFEKRKADFNAINPSQDPMINNLDKPDDSQELNNVNYFPDTVEVTHFDEVAIYIGGKYKLPTSQAGNCLKWWKDHSHKFSILAPLAWDYLACLATSASVERCFSAAADVCRRDRGKLSARTIELCVSSHQWLVQGVNPNGPFQCAQAVITEANEVTAWKAAQKEAKERVIVVA